jgi:hypothetical protein
MAALSLLADLRYSPDWTTASEQTRQAVESAEAFIADVFHDRVHAEAETPDQLTMNNEQLAKAIRTLSLLARVHSSLLV